MAIRFCAHCGNAFVDEARFCVQCGESRPGMNAVAGWSLTRYPALFIVGGLLLVGGGAVLLGTYQEKTPPQAPPRDAGPAPQPPGLPGDHPPVEIPAEVKTALADLQKAADSKPQDPEAWRHLSTILGRAAQVDRSYTDQAEKAYTHLLKLAPADLDALRGLGNMAFDREKHDDAIGFYERYLKVKPDDLSVQTDMGTMYLSKGDTARAVRTYDAVLKADPKFFQAQFNLAIAYRSAGQNDAAVAALQQAKAIAPDEQAKAQVDMLLARVQGGPAVPPPAAAGAEAAATEPKGTYREGVEAIFRQNQIMASKVQRFEWESDTKAKLFLTDFPMEQMPEGMRSMFLERMKDRLRKQKAAFQIEGPLSIELIDFADGKVMETLSE